MAALAPARSAATLSERELLASARRRLDALTAKHGARSPEVKAAMARWAGVLDHQGDDGLMDVVLALRPSVLTVRAVGGER